MVKGLELSVLQSNYDTLKASTVNSVGLSDIFGENEDRVFMAKESYNVRLVALFYRLCSKSSTENLLLRRSNMKTAPMSCTLAFLVSLRTVLLQSISSGKSFNLFTLECDLIDLMDNI